MSKIAHWTIKVTWEDKHGNPIEEAEEYINDIPDWVAEPIDEFLNSIEEDRSNEEDEERCNIK